MSLLLKDYEEIVDTTTIIAIEEIIPLVKYSLEMEAFIDNISKKDTDLGKKAKVILETANYKLCN